ncbi:MAG: FkbM family methyltransferase [Kiritimatiellales bacterium]|nr:FkbM family methyltransferase [Kiritimatiellales bacterium]MCF7863321.1 FkbM family methyltransferase [Kiritimatiellales bacterium]
MKKIIHKLVNRRARKEHSRIVRKWYADGGERSLRFKYDLDKDSIILDLGGYEGQWASDLFSRYQCRIHVFEPVVGFAQKIQERFRLNEKIEVHPFGLGGSSRTETIHLSADGSSVWGDSANMENIKIVDAHDWLVENGIGHIALAKINIEGGEYELLDRLIEKGFLSSVDNIQVQFHNIDSNSRARMERIQHELAKTHQPTYQYDFVWENWELKKP